MENHRAMAAGKKEVVQPQSTQAAATLPVPQQAEQKQHFRLTVEKVRQAANGGNAKAQQTILACVKNSPSICAEFGDAAKHVEMALIDSISGGEILTSAAITLQAEKMKKELAGPAPSALMEMAAQRVVATWLALQNSEMHFLQSQKNVQSARYWLRRLEVADKLYRAAIGSLVLIRDLLPAAAPASMPAIVDVSAQAAKPKASDMTEFPVPVEIPTGNGLGANRIADVLARRGASRCFVADDQVDEPPKLNGHHHRLEELLANGSNGHAGHGGSK